METGTITAKPTKTLFIDILTKDVDPSAGVLDLIDNAIDSYTRHEYSDKRQIKLTIDKEKFEIFDSCGGIAKKILEEDVFRFGVDEVKRDKPTLGLYGIGMKRALFKMGKLISLDTDDGEIHSVLKLDLNDWKEGEGWEMNFQYEDSKLNGKLPYTKINVSSLNSDISESYDLSTFICRWSC